MFAALGELGLSEAEVAEKVGVSEVKLKAWKEDPTNLTITEEYQELTESMTVWYTDWTGYMQCAAQEKYQKRFEEIGDKVEKGLEEMGLDD